MGTLPSNHVMNPTDSLTYHSAIRTLWKCLAGAFAIAAALAVLHLLYSDLREGGVYWFNLDKERNIPTWFSGMLFFLFGCSGVVAYHWEKRLNSDEAGFRLPILWLGVAFVGLFMSLDEITILHENLFWREVRHVSAGFGDSWKYVTQWQVLFAPAIFIVLGYFALFFSNRFSLSPRARRIAFGGIGCWLMALLLEGVRGTFRSAGGDWYFYQVLAEEVLEMAGAILLIASVATYTLAIALDLTPERRQRLDLASRFLGRRAATALAGVLLLLTASGGVILFMAQRQAAAGAPVPRLVRKALGSRSDTGGEVSNPGVSLPDSSTVDAPNQIWFGDIKGGISIEDAAAEKLLESLSQSLSQEKRALGALASDLQSDVAPRIVFLSVSEGKSHAAVAVGTGQGLKAALQQALSRLPKMASAGGAPVVDQAGYREISG